MSANLNNPYRPFFFVGTLASIFGTGVWISYASLEQHPYPGRLHAHLMMGVFLLNFVMGFLMTALPRLTQSKQTHRYEFLAASVLMGWLVSVGLYDSTERLFFIGSLLISAFLFFFAARRILKSTSAIPNFFPLIFLGVLSIFSGSLLVLFDHKILGEALFYQNFILCLVLGIGIFLIPRITGKENIPALPSKATFFILGMSITTLLLIYEQWGYTWANTLRAFIVSAFCIYYWRIFSKSYRKSSLYYGISISSLSINTGLWFLAFYPEYRLEALHLVYVSGFSLLTFMVASRVILSHGGYSLENEFKNKWIKATIFFVCLAALTRVAAQFIPNGYEKHLAYASAAFIVGTLCWVKFFFPRLFATAEA